MGIALLACLVANVLANIVISWFVPTHQYVYSEQLMMIGISALLFAFLRNKNSSYKTHVVLSSGYGALWAIVQFLRLYYS